MNKTLWVAFLSVLAACASREPTRTTSSLEPAKILGTGLIEIDYVRGNNLHRLVATAQSDSALVELFRDTILTKHGRIDTAKYQLLSKQAEDILGSYKTEKTQPDCRTPFVLKVQKENSVKQIEGCRGAEQSAALGKFIRDAEYLVLSQR